MPLYNTAIQKYLEKIRFENNETRGEMAKRLRISPSYLSLIEANKRFMNDKIFCRLAREYKLSRYRINKLSILRFIS